MTKARLILLVSILVLLVMQGVGLYGMLYNDRLYFVKLTALNLCITSLVFLLNCSKPAKSYLLTFILIAVSGFLIEVIGVKSQLIFGYYWYGHNMGPRLFEVPLVIGLNWGVLILSCGAIVHTLYKNLLIKAAVGACLMVLIDILIEPIAMKLGYWYWDVKQIPIQNYVAWWVISFIMLLLVFRYLKNPFNKAGIWVYGIQFIFFCLLHLLL